MKNKKSIFRIKNFIFKKALILVSLFFISIYNLSCSSASKKVSPSKIEALIYEISQDGHTAYIFGSIHYGLDFSELPKEVLSVFEQSSTVIIETDPNQASQLIRKKYTRGPRIGLKRQLTSTQWRQLVSRLSKALLKEQQIDRLHPFQAQLAYSLISFPQTKKTIDKQLYNLAITKNKKVGFIETPAEQVNAIEKTLNINSLKKLLDTPDAKLKSQVDQLIYSYKTGNIKDLYNLSIKNELTEDQKDEILLRRNIIWSNRIEKLIKNPGIELFIVSASHLDGYDGSLTDVLQTSGFKTTKK